MVQGTQPRRVKAQGSARHRYAPLCASAGDRAEQSVPHGSVFTAGDRAEQSVPHGSVFTAGDRADQSVPHGSVFTAEHNAVTGSKAWRALASHRLIQA